MHSDGVMLNSESETSTSGLCLLHCEVTSIACSMLCSVVCKSTCHAIVILVSSLVQCCTPYLQHAHQSVACNHLLHNQQKSEDPAEPACWLLQHAREEEIAERKAMKRAERDIARKKEYVRRVRLQIEEKRAEVSAALMQWVFDSISKLSQHAFYLEPNHF